MSEKKIRDHPCPTFVSGDGSTQSRDTSIRGKIGVSVNQSENLSLVRNIGGQTSVSVVEKLCENFPSPPTDRVQPNEVPVVVEPEKGQFGRSENLSDSQNDKFSRFPERIWGYQANHPYIIDDFEETSIDPEYTNRLKEVLSRYRSNVIKIQEEHNEFTSMKRGVSGLSQLPHRINTYERILKDSELIRIYSGKYQKVYEFIPFKKKSTGVAVGTIYQKRHTCSKKKETPKLWLGKVGFNEKDRFGSHEFTKIGDYSLNNERGYNLSVMLEYIANCLYRVLSDASFETPKNRLSEQNLSDEFTKDSFEVKCIIQNFKVKKSLRVMSKWCDEYEDLGKLKVKMGNGDIVNFVDFVLKERTIPSKVIEPTSQKEVEIHGLAGILAVSTSIGDPDVLGGTCANAGYIVNRNKDGIIVSIRIIKVDPGFSFLFENVRGENLCEEFKDPRDSRFCMGITYGIEWNKLSQDQKNEFLEVKIHNLEIIKDRRILEYIFFRRGKFNKEDSMRMTEKVSGKIIDELVVHIQREGKLFEDDIREYCKIRKEKLREQSKKNEDLGDYDRALCELEKVLEIMNSSEENIDAESKTQIGNVYGGISRIEMSRGNYENAIFFAWKQFNTLRDIPNASLTNCALNFGNVFSKTGDYDKTTDIFQTILNGKKESDPENHSIIAIICTNLGHLHLKKGEYDIAIENIKKSLSIQIEMSPDNQQDIANNYANLGCSYIAKGNYDLGIESIEISLEKQLVALPEDHPDIALNYVNLGCSYQLKGDQSRAIENFKKSLIIQLKTLPENHPDIAQNYGNLGGSYIEKCDYDLAMENIVKSLMIQQKSLPENHPDVAKNYMNLGMVCIEKGEFDAAIENINKSLEIQTKTLPENHPGIAENYLNLGRAYLEKSDYERAFKNINKSLAIQLVSLPNNHLDIAKNYSNLGNMYLRKGEYVLAIESIQKSLKIQLGSISQNHHDLAINYQNLGGSYIGTGEFDLAIENIEKSLTILLKSEKMFPVTLANIEGNYMNLVRVYLGKGDYDRGIENIKKSLEILLKMKPENHLKIARSYENLGELYIVKGDNDLAIENFKKSLAVKLKFFPGNTPEIAKDYSRLGDLYAKKGKYTIAIENIEKSIAIQTVLLPENHPDISVSYNNLGNLLIQKGEYKLAIQNIRKSFAIQLKTLPENHPLLAKSLINLGTVYLYRGESSLAIENFQKALEIQIISNPKDHPETVKTVFVLGEIYKGLGDFDTSIKYYSMLLSFDLKKIPGFSVSEINKTLLELQQQSQKSDDKKKVISQCVSNSKCTFEVTGEEPWHQKWYECKTCEYVDGMGMCESCKNHCHSGHEVKELSSCKCYCDCGAEKVKCRLMKSKMDVH